MSMLLISWCLPQPLRKFLFHAQKAVDNIKSQESEGAVEGALRPVDGDVISLVILSQWRDRKIGVMWQDLGALTAARTGEREFWSYWRLVIWDLGWVGCGRENYSNRVWSERWRWQWCTLWWNIKVRTDTTKLSNMVVASFGDGWNLIREGKMFIKDESKVASRVSGVKWRVVYLVKLLSESNE